MSIFRPRQPRHFQLDYRYARQKRLISDTLSERQRVGKGYHPMTAGWLLLLFAILLIALLRI